MFWAGLLIGLLFGASIGMFVMAVVVTASKEPPSY